MNSDTIPLRTNPAAVWIGRIFHPYWLCIPTLFAVLSDLPSGEALRWVLLCLGILLPTVMGGSLLLERRGHALYRRGSRDPLYIAGGIALIMTLLILIGPEGPRVLIACYAALVVWALAQAIINRLVTKISVHAGVAAGCFTGLLLLGRLDQPGLLIGAILVVALTLWARVTTRNHTLQQVLLGLIVGAVPVLIVFPLILN